MQTDSTPMPNSFFVRHLALKKFLGPDGHWVKSMSTASHFPNVLNAINTCLGRDLKNVELILHYRGNRRDRRIRMDDIR